MKFGILQDRAYVPDGKQAKNMNNAIYCNDDNPYVNNNVFSLKLDLSGRREGFVQSNVQPKTDCFACILNFLIGRQ